MCNGVQPEGSIAIREKIGEHLIAPAGTIIEWHFGIERLNVGPGALDEDGITNVDQNTGSFAADWLAPDGYFCYLDTGERPAGHGNCAGGAPAGAGGRVGIDNRV